MDAGAVVFALLSGKTDAVSVTPLILPQEPSYPAITYQQVSAVPVHGMGQDAALLRARVQVDSWGDTYAEARALASAVKAVLNRFRGPAAGVTVLDVLLNNEMDLYEGDTQTRRVMQDYTLLLQS